MIEKQKSQELQAFNRVAFLKFGGIEGLLTRFLQRTLDTRITSAQRQAAVKVLLALNFSDKAILPLLQKLLNIANQINLDYSYQKAEILTSIAEASVKLKSTDKEVMEIVEKALNAAKNKRYKIHIKEPRF